MSITRFSPCRAVPCSDWSTFSRVIDCSRFPGPGPWTVIICDEIVLVVCCLNCVGRRRRQSSHGGCLFVWTTMFQALVLSQIFPPSLLAYPLKFSNYFPKPNNAISKHFLAHRREKRFRLKCVYHPVFFYRVKYLFFFFFNLLNYCNT